jgi:hypothetical protein
MPSRRRRRVSAAGWGNPATAVHVDDDDVIVVAVAPRSVATCGFRRHRRRPRMPLLIECSAP